MSTPTYESLLESVRLKLISDFESAKRDVPHYGERGEELENIIIKWLNAYLPKRFSVGTGFILGVNNEISPQTDVIIYDAFNCPIIRFSDKSLILPADNVAITFEVKSNLTKKEFEDAVRKTKSIKAISKSPISEFDLLSEGAKKVVQRQTYSILFAFDSDVSLKTIASWYKESFINGRHIDYICILDKGWIDLFIKITKNNEYYLIICSEAITKPKELKSNAELWIGYHEEPDNALYFMLRNIISYLQMFRSQMFIPIDQKPTICNLLPLGTLPAGDDEGHQQVIRRLIKLDDIID